MTRRWLVGAINKGSDMSFNSGDDENRGNHGGNSQPGTMIGAGIAIGAALGVAMGLALGNLALGSAIGAAIGVALSAAMEQSRGNRVAGASGTGRRSMLALVIAGMALLGGLGVLLFLALS